MSDRAGRPAWWSRAIRPAWQSRAGRPDTGDEKQSAATDGRQPLLKVSGVGKAFGGVRAVEDISFEVFPDEVFGIAGPNGAGKTTLVNSLSGVPFHADDGTVKFKGRRIERLAPHAIFRAGVARTFQQETCFESLTVEQNVRIGAAFGDINGRRRRAAAVREALELTGLTDYSAELAGALKLYDKKRVMLASALVAQPEVLMLDEPAAGLSAAELEELTKLVNGLNQSGLAIVLIEHVLALLFSVSHRVMIMDHGTKLAEGKPEDIAKDPRVIEAYLGERGKAAWDAPSR